MKIEILKENLKSILGITDRITGKNLSLPILDNVLIQGEDTYLHATATDLETITNGWVLCKVIKKGSVVIPAKFLSQFISSLPNEKIILESEGHNLQVQCGNLTTTIQGQNPEDFPLIPEFKALYTREIEISSFCQGLSQVVGVAYPSQTRQEIAGVYFSFTPKTLTLAATDSFRLAEKKITLSESKEEEYSFILPQKPAREVVNILEGKQGTVKLAFSQNQVLFEILFPEGNHPAIQIISRLVEGEYPNYQEIIPSKFKTNMVVKKDELLGYIKSASLFANKNNEVKFLVNNNQKEVGIHAQNPTIGEYSSQYGAKITGEELGISFNYKFLIDGLVNIKSSEAAFDFSKEDGPCVIKPVGDASYVYVVMPIKSI